MNDDTPETSVAWRYPASFDSNEKVVHISVAQRLERERDEAIVKYDALATEHMLAVNKLCNERDKALENFRLAEDERIDMAKQLHSEKECRAVCQNERDELRNALHEIANASHFDNIGNWARNKAKKTLEEIK